MMQLFHACFSPVNAPYTILLVVVLVYWLSVIVGLADVDSFDFDGDVDADMDVDVDGDADADLDAHHGLGHSILHFFNVGEVPLMILVSFCVLGMWATSIMVNHILGNKSLIFATVFFVPNFIVSAFAAKIISTPFKFIFSHLEAEGQSDDEPEAVGRVCRITTSKANANFGQAEIETEGAPIILNVRTSDGRELPRGTLALVYDFDKDRNIYFVEEYDSV